MTTPGSGDIYQVGIGIDPTTARSGAKESVDAFKSVGTAAKDTARDVTQAQQQIDRAVKGSSDADEAYARHNEARAAQIRALREQAAREQEAHAAKVAAANASIATTAAKVEVAETAAARAMGQLTGAMAGFVTGGISVAIAAGFDLVGKSIDQLTAKSKKLKEETEAAIRALEGLRKRQREEDAPGSEVQDQMRLVGIRYLSLEARRDRAQSQASARIITEEDAIAVARAQTLVRALTGEMEKLRAEQMAGQREFDRLRDHVEPFSDAVANAGGNIEAATPKVERLSQTVDKGALAADRMRDALTAERAALAGVDPALVAFDKRVETMARSLAAYPALLKQWRTEMTALRQQLVATEIQEVNDALDRALRERLAKLGAEHGRDLQSSMSGSLRAGISVASKSVDDSLRASEAARERAERPLLQAAENVQRAFGDLWTRVFDGGIRSFADIADFARQTFARLAGEVAAMWAQKSLAGPMLSMLGVGGAGGSSVDGPLGRINIPSVSSLQGMTWGKGIGSAGAGLGLGYALGGMTQSSIGGFALGAASGAGAGFAVGGPMGAVIGGLAGAVGGLLGAGTAQQEAARAMREAAETWKVASKALYGYGNGAYGERQGREDDIRSRFANAEAGFLAQFHPDVQKNIRAHGGVTAFAEMVRGNPSGWAGGEQAVEFADALKAALQRAQQEFFEDWGLSMAGLSARQMAASGNARGADDLRFAMAQDEERFAAERRFGVDTEEGRAYLEQLKKAQELEKAERERMRAEREADLRADYDVRALRAESRSEEAEALQLRLAQEREYREAERAGLDAATLARLKEVQAMEATSKAAERAAEARRALEDLDVRALTAGGRDREADELRFRLNQERELEDAIRGGRGADYLTRLREVQELERQARARAAAAPEAAGLSDAGETRASVYARGTITGASAQAVDTLISLGQAQTGWLMLIERNTRGGGATETVGNVAGTSVTDGRAFDRYQGQRYRQLRAGVGARRIVFMS